MSVDWFRNTTWNEKIESRFKRKLARSKLQAQYLRIQASTLARKEPEVSLSLLEQYFELPDDIEQAAAHADRAVALLTLDRNDEAVAAYEAAIAREEKYPKVQTQAHLELPFVIAMRQLEAHYDRAIELLEKYSERLLFPADHFKANVACALIAAARGDLEAAATHRDAANTAAEQQHSGFASHPEAGLVGDRFDDVKAMLAERIPDGVGS